MRKRIAAICAAVLALTGVTSAAQAWTETDEQEHSETTVVVWLMPGQDHGNWAEFNEDQVYMPNGPLPGTGCFYQHDEYKIGTDYLKDRLAEIVSDGRLSGPQEDTRLRTGNYWFSEGGCPESQEPETRTEESSSLSCEEGAVFTTTNYVLENGEWVVESEASSRRPLTDMEAIALGCIDPEVEPEPEPTPEPEPVTPPVAERPTHTYFDGYDPPVGELG